METLSFDEFYDLVGQRLADILKKRLPVAELRKEYKERLQGQGYYALTVDVPFLDAAVHLNVENIYSCAGSKSIEEIAGMAADMVMARLITLPEIEADEIIDYDKAKNNLIIQVISAERNEKLLASIPHKRILDLAVIYRLMIKTSDGWETCIVNNMLFEEFGISQETLYKDAALNSARINPVKIENLAAVGKRIAEMLGYSTSVFFDEYVKSPLYFVGNEDCTFGAAAVFYPGVLEKCAEILNGSFFILPSSIHEMLILKAGDDVDVGWLERMVSEINEEVIDPEERLTDHVYYYDACKKEFCAA
ncbi:MAG: DUF5688 family protein [Eubacteriales bacterium]|nr:DUF5688 family protein [Eubacteriales bacterium]